MKKVLTAIVTFIFAMCLLMTTVASVSAAAVKKVTGFTASAKPTEVTLTWKKTSGAKGYEVQQKSGKKWKTVATIKKQKTTSYTVKKLKNGTTYQFRIRAVNGKKKGAYVTAKVKTGVQKITGVKATSVSLTSVKLTWDKANVTGYEIQRKDGKKWKTVTKIKKAKTTSYTVKKLSAGKSVTFRIRGYVPGSAKTFYGSYTEVKAKTAVPALTTASVKSVTDSSVTLTWSKIGDANGYEIQQKSGKKWSTVATVKKAKTTSYTVKKLSALTNYEFRVRAYQTSGKKTYYNSWKTIKAKTAIGNVSSVGYSSLSASSVKITWKAAPGAAGYRVMNNGSKVADVKTTSATLSVKAATAYKITVVPYNGSVTGKASSAVSFTTPCAKVTGVKVSKTTDSTVALTWTKATGAKSYQIQYSTDTKNWKTVTSSSNSVTVSKLNANTKYYFRVAAVNQNGSKNQNGAYSATVNATTPLGIATNLKIASLKAKSVTLSWTAARGAKSYIILNNGKQMATATSTSVNLTLTPATSYKLTVVGVGGSAKSAASKAIEFTSAPDKVSGVTTTALADKVSVEWTAVTGAAGYEVYYKAGNTWYYCGAVEGTGYTVDELTVGSAYSFKVCAYNYNGSQRQTGDFSDEKEAVPTTQFFTEIDSTAKKLSWNAISGAESYSLIRYDAESSYKWIDNYLDCGKSTTIEVNNLKNPIEMLKVVAYDAEGNAIYTSAPAYITKDGYSVVQNGCQVTFSWPAQSGATTYKITRTGGNFNESQDFSTNSAEYFLAPGLLHRFTVKVGTSTILRFAVETPKMNLTDTSDAAVNAQLAYLAEGINRTKSRPDGKLVIDSEMTTYSDINYMKFGVEDGGLGVTLLLKTIFGDMLEGTNHEIKNGYIECKDRESVEKLMTFIEEEGASVTTVNEKTTATFDGSIQGTLVNHTTGKTYKYQTLSEVIQPTKLNKAYIYNIVDPTAWKKGFESVKMTRTFEGYEITAVLKQETNNTSAPYHSGLVDVIGEEDEENGVTTRITSNNIGKTTLKVVVDDQCRLLSYDIDMPYNMDMSVITSMSLSGESSDSVFGDLTELNIEIVSKMAVSQKVSATFTHSK